jgi:hypothetical protein
LTVSDLNLLHLSLLAPFFSCFVPLEQDETSTLGASLFVQSDSLTATRLKRRHLTGPFIRRHFDVQFVIFVLLLLSLLLISRPFEHIQSVGHFVSSDLLPQLPIKHKISFFPLFSGEPRSDNKQQPLFDFGLSSASKPIVFASLFRPRSFIDRHFRSCQSAAFYLLNFLRYFRINFAVNNIIDLIFNHVLRFVISIQTHNLIWIRFTDTFVLFALVSVQSQIGFRRIESFSALNLLQYSELCLSNANQLISRSAIHSAFV